MPSPGTPGTADVELISPDRQLRYLDTRLQERGPSFELILERAVILRDAGAPQQAQSDWQWCFEHLDDGTVPQILALAELVRAAGDPASLRVMQLKMFAAHRIGSFLHSYHQGKLTDGHFRRYLANLPRSGLLPKATCEQLLSVDDERARLHAVQQLIRREDVLGVDTVLEWVSDARLSDADATALLALNPNFAVERLQSRTGDATVCRLLDELGQVVEPQEVIRVGHWAHSDAGWGRIERIENPRTHADVQWIARRRGSYWLHVTLRPDVSAERIVVDLALPDARFTEPGRVLACTQCGDFATQRKACLHRHCQVAHPIRGKDAKSVTEQIKYRFLEQPISLQLLEFSSDKPTNQWA